jgi:hypothetical protein
MQSLVRGITAAVDAMPRRFTSHQFLAELARRNQPEYLDALHAHASRNAPFRAVHAAVARRLHRIRGIQYLGHVSSANVFGQRGSCALWART